MVNNISTFRYHSLSAHRLWSTVPSWPVFGFTIYSIKWFQGRWKPTCIKKPGRCTGNVSSLSGRYTYQL